MSKYKAEYNQLDAFPMCASDMAGGVHERYGMTLLDWFAGQALSGLDIRYVDVQERAAWAYKSAAAMMEERKKYLIKEVSNE